MRKTPEQQTDDALVMIGVIITIMSLIGFGLMIWFPDALSMGIGCGIMAGAIWFGRWLGRGHA